jgi:hypothetical protein
MKKTREKRKRAIRAPSGRTFEFSAPKFRSLFGGENSSLLLIEHDFSKKSKKTCEISGVVSVLL